MEAICLYFVLKFSMNAPKKNKPFTITCEHCGFEISEVHPFQFNFYCEECFTIVRRNYALRDLTVQDIDSD